MSSEKRRIISLPIVVTIFAVLLHIAFCYESPLVNSDFHHSFRNWLIAFYYSTIGIALSLPLGLVLKLLPSFREKWAYPIMIGLCLGLLIRLGSYAIPEEYTQTNTSPILQTTDGVQQEFVSTDGRYAVRFPSSPTTSTITVQMASIPAQVTLTRSTFNSGEYLVSYMDLTDSMMPFGADVYLDSIKMEITSMVNGSETAASNISFGGYSGRVFSVSGQVSGVDIVLQCRMYLVGQRFYRTVVSAKESDFDNTQSNSFFDSFRLLQAN